MLLPNGTKNSQTVLKIVYPVNVVDPLKKQ